MIDCCLIGELQIVVISDCDPVLGFILVPEASLLFFVLHICIDKQVECIKVNWCLANFFDSMRHFDLELDLVKLIVLRSFRLALILIHIILRLTYGKVVILLIIIKILAVIYILWTFFSVILII